MCGCLSVSVYEYGFYTHRYKVQYVDKGISCVWSPFKCLKFSVHNALSAMKNICSFTFVFSVSKLLLAI